MTAILEERHSSAAEWSRRVGAFTPALFLTSALSHRFGLIETLPFLWLLGLCLVLAVLGLCLALAGFVQFWRYGFGGLGSAALGAVLCLATLSPYAVSAYRFAVHPELSDLSTDRLRPPQLVAAGGLRSPPMNPVTDAGASPAMPGDFPELSGRRYEQDRETVVAAVEGLLAERGWEVVSPAPEGEEAPGVTIEAVARSYLLGFPSDVAIRIEDRADATHVDMRSASRYGRHDLGDNAMRIERFLRDLDLRMQGVAAPEPLGEPEDSVE
ncbi:DUF1499 domain-containing protein [Chelativorans sp.]|uniref:DUF1499 domain-containing protein n=1 Tax=Chelativorans sp. TaxID=2203393 RepID=UPI0028115173|nr:DUF1499 domain-containing protein [Chelativorans sp.]